jgi:thiol-disulfide isomerase/thioredoxin
MRTRKFITSFLALTAAPLMLAGATAEPTLKVGDTAPALQTGKWVQGEPVKKLETGKAYLVEFWATWCGPCRVSIPHLNELHNQFKNKGLIVIGQDCWERDEKLVEPFIAKMGDKMTYRVALDDKEGSERGKMAESWMAAAGRNGIPSAFLVGTKGKIAWIGHPMALKPELIEEVLAGTFDIEKAARDYDVQQKNEALMRPIQKAISQAVLKKDWDEAAAKLDEAAKLLPADKQDGLLMTRFNVLLGKKDYPAAYKLAEDFSDRNKDEVNMQNELAWRLVTDRSIDQPNLQLAEKIAQRACDASNNKNAQILDTLARIKFLKNEREAAIQLQEKAVSLAEANTQAQFQKTLDSYKSGKLPAAN